jgi:hypothetical protein
VDSLYERLERAPEAEWEIVPVDGNVTRPDLMEGDILKVTAEDGTEKQYYIQMMEYEGSHTGQLSSITWPDIPDKQLFNDVYGWKNDTIPGFDPGGYNYQLKLPPEIEQVPATVAKVVEENSVVTVQKAINLASYNVEDRTTVYTVTAEDDTTINDYVIEWQREQLPSDIQPYYAEPFISEFLGRYYFSNNHLEICNPGNQVLDLSNYMFVTGWSANPAEAIQADLADDWMGRYDKYVPGRKWVDSTTWKTSPNTLEVDLGVNALVQPGDVFVMTGVLTSAWWGYGRTGWHDTTQTLVVESDVEFYNTKTYDEATGEYTGGYNLNPWGEPVATNRVPMPNADWGEILYVFKIVGEGGDSVRAGLKPATDPNDFELIESMGNLDVSQVIFGQVETIDGFNFTTFIRKPQYVFPKAGLEESFGDTINPLETTEWKMVNRRTPEVVPGWPDSWIHTAVLDFGKHYFIPTTTYLSTVSSNFYRVSLGFDIEDIEGVVDGETVETFLPKLTKADPNQALKVVSGTDGSELAADAAITNGDTLIVISADSVNTTRYVLDVSADGLNSDAVLTSDVYTVEILEDPSEDNDYMGEGAISGFPYMTTLETVLDNVTEPAGATITALDEEGHFVPVNRLNYDTMYVKATVSEETFLKVVAEDMVTTISYILVPDGTSDDANVYSDFFDVVQESRLINLVPPGISVERLFDKLYPSAGATMVVVDKSGLVREATGIVRYDDKLVVTSESGEVTNTYFLSFSIPTANLYLVYVLSDEYDVDNVEYVIDLVPEGTTVEEFLLNLIPSSLDAIIGVVDANLTVKLTGELAEGDLLVISNADMTLVIPYSIVLVSTESVDLDNTGQIHLYPNPTNGLLHISGLITGQRIQVYSSTGTMIRDMKVNAITESISLDDQPAGMFIIVVSDDEQVARFKAIKQ